MRRQPAIIRSALCTALCAALCLGTGIPLMAEDTENTVDMTAMETAAKADDTLPARSAILMEQDTGRVLFEKNADEKLPPASITKVMTLLLVMEAIDEGRMNLTDPVTCSDHAASMGGSQIWLEPGEQMSIDELLKATAISSANDAAVALAEHVAGSEEAFVQQMNERAAALGMTNTVFMNVTGLDTPGHCSTARDIAIMSRQLLRYKLISDYSKVWMSSLRNGSTQLVNTNKLVRFYDGCTGLKTGTTDGAGSCLSASATRRGLSLVAVTLGSPTSAERFSAARGLLDYGFANYLRAPIPSLDPLTPVKVLHGVSSEIEVLPVPPESIIVKSGEQVKIAQKVELAPEVEAPVESGQKLGKVTVTVNGEPVTEYDLVAADAVERMNFLKALEILCKSLFTI